MGPIKEQVVGVLPLQGLEIMRLTWFKKKKSVQGKISSKLAELRLEGQASAYKSKTFTTSSQ